MVNSYLTIEFSLFFENIKSEYGGCLYFFFNKDFNR